MGDYDFSYNVIVNSDNKFELKEEYDDDSVLTPYIDFKPNLKYRFHQNDNSNTGNTFKLFYKDQFKFRHRIPYDRGNVCFIEYRDLFIDIK